MPEKISVVVGAVEHLFGVQPALSLGMAPCLTLLPFYCLLKA
jgi:hypothetical protein